MKKIVFLIGCLGLLTGLCSAAAVDDVQIHGFLSQGFIKTDHNNYMAETEEGSFEFNELGLNFTKPVSGRLRLGMQFFARDLGKDGNDKLVLDWAIADYRWRDWLGFRVGRIKNSYGYYASIWDFDMLRNVIFIPRIYIEMERDAFTIVKGFAFYGDVDLGAWGSVSYNLVNGLVNVSKDCGIASGWEDFWQEGRLQVDSMSSDFSLNMDIKYETPIDGVTAGMTLYRVNDMHVKGSLMGVEGGFHEVSDWTGGFLTLRYTWEELVIMGEFMQTRMDRKIDAFHAGFLPADVLTAQGWYGSMAWQFTDFFTAEYMYNVFYMDKDNKDGKALYDDKKLNKDVLFITGKPKQKNDFEAWTKANTVSFRFDITPNWLVKFETVYNDGFGEYTSARTDNLKRYWWLYAVKVTYNF